MGSSPLSNWPIAHPFSLSKLPKPMIRKNNFSTYARFRVNWSVSGCAVGGQPVASVHTHSHTHAYTHTHSCALTTSVREKPHETHIHARPFLSSPFYRLNTHAHTNAHAHAQTHASCGERGGKLARTRESYADIHRCAPKPVSHSTKPRVREREREHVRHNARSRVHTSKGLARTRRRSCGYREPPSTLLKPAQALEVE